MSKTCDNCQHFQMRYNEREELERQCHANPPQCVGINPDGKVMWQSPLVPEDFVCRLHKAQSSFT